MQAEDPAQSGRIHSFLSHLSSAPWLGNSHRLPRFWRQIPKHQKSTRVLTERDPTSPSLTPLPSLEKTGALGISLPSSGNHPESGSEW